MSHNTKIGKIGEEIAVKFLKNQGYKIIDANYHSSNLEVDIIASIDDCVVFVEVKTRAVEDDRKPESFVDRNKQEAMIKVMKKYMSEHNYREPWKPRFDIVSVTMKKDRIKIKHIQGAFLYLPNINPV